MINESTKNVKGVKPSPDGAPAPCDDNWSKVTTAPTSGAVHVPGALRQEPQRTSSRDSLRTLQQLVDRGDQRANVCGSKPFLNQDSSSYGISPPIENVRSDSCTTTTNFLRPRMQFAGYQISGYKKYQVVINLKTVALPTCGATCASPHVTGFLTIRGLTNQHPEITTYFESFAVTHRELGLLSSSWSKDSIMSSYRADDQTDLEHWLNFPAFKQMFLADGSRGDSPTLSDVIDGTCEIDNYLEQRFVFMRWKEKYLVPEELSEGVEGASYDGFYYIVHDQVTGNIQGFYYHKNAEKFQQLELVPSEASMEDCFDCGFEMA